MHTQAASPTQAENILFLFDGHQLPFWRSAGPLKLYFHSGFIQYKWMCVQAENHLYKWYLYDTFTAIICSSFTAACSMH